MKVFLSKQFYKSYHKRFENNKELKERFADRLALFSYNPQNPLLRDHPLKGDKKGLRAFSVTGDVRAVYHVVGDTAFFVTSALTPKSTIDTPVPLRLRHL